MTVIFPKLKSCFNTLSGLGISRAPGLSWCCTGACNVPPLSQAAELIELLAIHAVCSLDSKDAVSGGEGRLSGAQRTGEPASRTRPLSRRVALGTFKVARPLPRPSNPEGAPGHFEPEDPSSDRWGGNCCRTPGERTCPQEMPLGSGVRADV